MRNLEELNINERGKPVSRSAPSLEAIRDFEKTYNLKIPEIYLRLLRHSNGGHPELDVFGRCDNEGKLSQWSVNQFYHISSEKEAAFSIWVAFNNWSSYLDIGELPFAEDPGGNLYFMNTKNDDLPVSVCIHDESFRKIQIAQSFEAFIDGLSIDPDMI